MSGTTVTVPRTIAEMNELSDYHALVMTAAILRSDKQLARDCYVAKVYNDQEYGSFDITTEVRDKPINCHCVAGALLAALGGYESNGRPAQIYPHAAERAELMLARLIFPLIPMDQVRAAAVTLDITPPADDEELDIDKNSNLSAAVQARNEAVYRYSDGVLFPMGAKEGLEAAAKLYDQAAAKLKETA